MPELAPAFDPPSSSLNSSSSTASSFASRNSMSPVSSVPTSPEREARKEDETKENGKAESPERVLTIPAVKLGSPTISDEMAAHLSISLIGHVLFLKSQVPFPVMQLARMSGGKSSNARAAKKRAEFMNAFDELTSHLHTTFSALATALARSRAGAEAVGAVPTTTAYLGVVLGPTVGTAKARVLMAIEGLEVKEWGTRDEDAPEDDETSDESGEEESESEPEPDSDSDAASDSGNEQPPPSPPVSVTFSRPPSLRGPSPAPTTSSSSSPQNMLRGTSSSPSQPHLVAPQRTHAEQQQEFRLAERLLSRTLANACADGPGMAVELAPTQTHVLLRAPRRFAHPAWVPRQNLTSSLDTVLSDFLQDAGLQPSAGKRRPRRGVRTEGVLVGCAAPQPQEEAAAAQEFTGEEEDENEMIWWAWSGKLAGFAEW